MPTDIRSTTTTAFQADAARIDKVDHGAAIPIEQCDTNVCAAWANDVDEKLEQINEAFVAGSRVSTLSVENLVVGDATIERPIAVGAGSPETVMSASAGALWLSDEGSAYVKESGTGATGWRPLADEAVADANRNLILNGDLRIWTFPTFVPNVAIGGAPTMVVETTDFKSAGRSLRLTQAGTADDRWTMGIRVPDRVDWITVCVRYKNISSTSIKLRAVCGTHSAEYIDTVVAGGEPVGQGWRVAHFYLPASKDTGGMDVGTLGIYPDDSAGGGEVLLDAMWAVPGRAIASESPYAERIEWLERPVAIVTATGVVANQLWGPISLASLTGLAQAPATAMGAILRVSITTTGTTGVLPGPHYVYVDRTPGFIPPHKVYSVYANETHDDELSVRLPTGSPGISGGYIGGGTTDYTVWLLGWII